MEEEERGQGQGLKERIGMCGEDASDMRRSGTAAPRTVHAAWCASAGTCKQAAGWQSLHRQCHVPSWVGCSWSTVQTCSSTAERTWLVVLPR